MSAVPLRLGGLESAKPRPVEAADLRVSGGGRGTLCGGAGCTAAVAEGEVAALVDAGPGGASGRGAGCVGGGAEKRGLRLSRRSGKPSMVERELRLARRGCGGSTAATT